jgi:hypothetical protein
MHWNVAQVVKHLPNKFKALSHMVQIVECFDLACVKPWVQSQIKEAKKKKEKRKRRMA